jgi:hypothetical protein
MMSHVWGIFRKSPDMSFAAKAGSPMMTSMRPGIPASVPPAAAGGAAPGTSVTGDVSASTVGPGDNQLDQGPDSRANPPKPPAEGAAPAEAAKPAEGAKPEGAAATGDAQNTQPLPNNRSAKPPKKTKTKKTKTKPPSQ